MARRRNQKSPAEALAGIVGVLIFLAMINPVFRNQLSSAVAITLSVLVLVGIVGLVIYLIVQMKKKDGPPLPYPVRSSTRQSHRSEPVRSGVPSSSCEPSTTINNFDIGGPVTPQFVKPTPSKWDDTVLKVIEWRRFEKVTKEFLSMNGYVAVETKTGADGGVDIRVHKAATPEAVGIVQCKAWNTYKVGIKVVRELFGVMAADRVKMGMVITSGEFTSEAEEFGKGKMTLVSGQRFLELIRKLSEDKQQHLLNVALEGDYSTPTCPQCDVKMALRESTKGRSAGGHFWGCMNYPRCKQTLVYKGD
ncbi:restriction endonuclease [Citrifermentans bremense]|uniref:restriction endonuclease n=1 Tax=Citrifermentans bremense TaxID=60035 RepID=UPI000685551D|nr:restriction endonuclease [Citrifermentans bremense]